ncbi:MAG: hypothetical protein IJM44_03745 [Ruminococcus sp.]|nr:hypothetical protein [Ruminococcus sp.]
MKKLEALKSLYSALGGTSSTVATCDTTIEVLNAILALGEVDAKPFIGDAIAAIAENAESILPSGVLVTKTITANGTYSAESDEADGYSSVSVEVEPVLQDKTVTPTTSQQTITADEGKDGLGTVTVSAVTAAIDENITAGNIKSGVTILGVEGTYDGT